MNFVDGVLHFDNHSAPALIREFGSPLYVYEAATLRRQIERVTHAFRGLPCRPAYALKANDNLAILRLIAEHGFSFDAVSPGEIFLLEKAGIPGERIWFTCSNVSARDFECIDDPAIVINLNSMSELDTLLHVGKRNPIALRVNPDVGAGHHKDVVTGGFGVKFGFELAEISEAMMIATDEGLDLVGLHAHIGSGVNRVEPFISSARVLIEIAARVPTLKWLNFGGGIATPYRPGESDFPIEEYGAALAAVAGEFLRTRGVTAIVEPGRYIVAEAGTLLSCVTTKRVSGGVEWIGCDTGFNHLARPSKYGAYHHIINASNGSDEDLRWSFVERRVEAASVVAGNLCESGDVFTRGGEGPEPRYIPTSHIGDIIAFCDAGAYGFAMASHYNARLLPAEVLVDGPAVKLIRARQTLEDLVRGQ